jgi:hypothetical protein
MQLAPERQLLFWPWRLKKQNCCVGGRNNKVALWMYHLKYQVNKSSYPSAVWQTYHIIPPIPAHPWD